MQHGTRALFCAASVVVVIRRFLTVAMQALQKSMRFNRLMLAEFTQTTFLSPFIKCGMNFPRFTALGGISRRIYAASGFQQSLGTVASAVRTLQWHRTA